MLVTNRYCTLHPTPDTAGSDKNLANHTAEAQSSPANEEQEQTRAQRERIVTVTLHLISNKSHHLARGKIPLGTNHRQISGLLTALKILLTFEWTYQILLGP